MELIANKTNPPLSSLILIAASTEKINVAWSDNNCLTVSGVKFDSTSAIARYLGRSLKSHNWFGTNALEESEINHWIMYSQNMLTDDQLKAGLLYLDKIIAPVTYLVGNQITLGDIIVWCKLYSSPEWNALSSGGNIPTNVSRWFKTISHLDFVSVALDNLPSDVQIVAQRSSRDVGRKEEGKFVDLPGAEMGKVVVRFPPEASGYLHIGHAKAALLNQYYQQTFKGTLIMRFDDTNPSKEKEDFEKVILEDLEFLQVKYDRFTHTSDYFDLMLELCEKLMKQGHAYVDDTDPENMKLERSQKVESKNRQNSVDKNMKMWSEMKAGTDIGQKCCVRAKIDMSSPNGCLRDPTIYRCKNEVHPKTGTKYKVYPTYDFACPIVDSIEGVTHCLRTMEYHDRDEQFYWFIDVLGLRKPYIWEYSRLNMTNTVLSKRKLTWFVDNRHVDGWDDPRMPTVRGVLRRGMTVDGLKQFIIAQGSSKSVVFMEWDKIWAINKKIIDPVAPRFTAVEADYNVPVEISGVEEAPLTVAKHPKNDVGTKTVWVSSVVLVDETDAALFKVGENVTFINWGNITIKEIVKKNGNIVKVNAVPNLEDKNYKKTMKITWLAKTPKSPTIPCVCVYFDNLISKGTLSPDEDFKNYLNQNTKVQIKMLGDPELASLNKSDIIQLQRKGFFICDRPYEKRSIHTGLETPIVLFSIPDGHTKVMQSMIPQALAKTATQPETKPNSGGNNSNELSAQIAEQGNKVRDLKQQKADKKTVSDEVAKLLALKANYKTITGQDWSPGNVAPIVQTATAGGDGELGSRIAEQGNKVRDLKSQKADKKTIEEEVKKLLALKAEYKSKTGKDWAPSPADNSAKSSTVNDNEVSALVAKISEQGNKVRDLKSKKADKNILDGEVKTLLALKAEYKSKTGKDFVPTAAPVSLAENKNRSVDEGSELSAKVEMQGNKIRELKSAKAPKSDIEAEVKILLSLKAEYKSKTGKDWTPPAADNSAKSSKVNDNEVSSIVARISEQGNKVRDLKSKKADKNILDGEVKTLLALKAEYKSKTGKDFVPTAAPVSSTDNKNKSVDEGSELSIKVETQGNKIRELKTAKAPKAEIDAEVKILLSLKAEYKSKTGKDWTPATSKDSKNNEIKKDDTSKLSSEGAEISAKITAQGDKVRNLKNSKAAKNILDEEIKILLSLKEEFKNKTGTAWAGSPAPRANEPPKAKNNSNNQPTKKDNKGPKKPKPEKEDSKKPTESGVKKVTRLGLEASKATDLPEWYSQVITKGELIEYYDVSGCYILRPWAFSMWETIKDWLDTQFKSTGVKNCYFPIFVSKAALEKEKSHIADFSPEVAWVTKSGDSDLAEPIAIRPTSETVMYPAYAKWIQSYRDLPIKLNQWNNVVRWEFKHPQPFLRTREFLWQEGHTAFASKEEAEEEVTIMLGFYEKVYTDILAIPVVKGRKTTKEKFAGGDYTLTVEAYISASGRAIQGATSHHLGQNFSKMFELVFEDPETQEKKFVYQNSWGMTTRTIGVMIMVHADDQGLVLPPRVAPTQVIIVPCGIAASLPESEKNKLLSMCKNLTVLLSEGGIRTEADLRDNYSSGWKFNHWELKGVPLRLEVGPKDMAAQQVIAVRRDTGVKTVIEMKGLIQSVTSLLDVIQASMLKKATEELHQHMILCSDWDGFCQNLEMKNIIQAPFCGSVECEDKIKNDSTRNDAETNVNAPSMGAKSLCIPHTPLRPLSPDDKCIYPTCNEKPQFMCLFGRSY